ncbi:MAG: DUF2335 domain-containing protein [Chloroflexi bacterium]|nr:DUF2335 domain-containing protein [Chloroflexota bacterium]MYA93828.1 DUF2335 domain-containing protein [Chloroflexota bacterium]MYC55249.1 DUF2335 domain-containing protein [Chloroflexota bacterium]MYD39883.1 DUF2335 domain-containing protein [Chloroflexota bacterium]MYE79300.1 DUF2335 domain-containing protein [Chloroflexota bacterium]
MKRCVPIGSPLAITLPKPLSCANRLSRKRALVSDSEANKKDSIEDSLIPPELMEYIPEEKREEVISRIVLQEQYSGPLAHPRIIAGYERYLSGSTDRILAMAEEQLRHRLQMEDRGQQAAIERDKRAMNRGFVLASVLMLLSAFALYLGSDLVGFGFVATSVVSLAGVFLYSHRSARQELREKRQALQRPSIAPELPESAKQTED